MRLIDADKLLDAMEDTRKVLTDAPYEPPFYACGLHDGYVTAMLDIQHAPSVDAVPVRHAHWIYNGSLPATFSGCRRICGSYDDDSADRYCSCCGAKMDEKDDECETD